MIINNSEVFKFEYPKELESYIDFFYTKDEQTLIEILNEVILNSEEIKARLACKNMISEDLEEVLLRAYKRDVVTKVDAAGQIKYNLLPMTFRINNCAIYDRAAWESIEEKKRQYLALFHFENYLKKKKNSSFEQLKANKNTILPINEIIEYARMHKDDVITVIPCDCRSKFGECGFDKNVCISFGGGINTPHDKGLGKDITFQETVEILNQCEKEGLIHSAEASSICNCCSCCCYPLSASKELGLKGRWPEVKYIVELDRDKCISCGKCVKRCQFGAFEKEGKQLILDKEKCWGCGVCTTECPVNALSLQSNSL